VKEETILNSKKKAFMVTDDTGDYTCWKCRSDGNGRKEIFSICSSVFGELAALTVPR